ncbi:ankyrin repeat-containing domain protein [Chlamydoabsidia padenii]|nr:ankyrin repeat-containing domain protein [Chlamydoabsidia padenii]
MPSTPIYNPMTSRLHRVNEDQPPNPRDCLLGLVDQLEDKNLQQVLKIELKRLLADHDRQVYMLEKHSHHLQLDNEELKTTVDTIQQRHEKAVREMQFFKKKYERLLSTMTMPNTPTSTLSTGQRSLSSFSYGSSDYSTTDLPPPPPPVSTRSKSTTTTTPPIIDPQIRRPRQNSSSANSMYSNTSDTQSIHSNNGSHKSSSSQQSDKQGRQRPTAIIQQRRVDPLTFGGADGLWDTITKSKGSDVTVEKIISNFLRRGGSPNTAKQQSSSQQNIVKQGYGLIHAMVVTKATGSLDLLLQQGANPNAMTLSTAPDEKVPPCYLAARIGWLAGLEMLVQAGGDLGTNRGPRNKTVLHVAAEHCHVAVVEYIVQVTQGQLNTQVDAHGATVLHYACASGHTDLVSFLAQGLVLIPDHQGEQAIHWAARHGRLEVVTLLIERYGVDYNTYVPKKVGTPLDLAKAGNHRRLVDYLKTLGGLSAKKMDKRREEELVKQVPGHFESTLAKHGLFADTDGL